MNVLKVLEENSNVVFAALMKLPASLPPLPPFFVESVLKGQRLGGCTLILSGASRSLSLKFAYFPSHLCLCV